MHAEPLRVEPIEGDDLIVKIYASEGAPGDDLARAIEELERLYVVLWDEGPWDDEGDGQPYYEGWLRHRSQREPLDRTTDNQTEPAFLVFGLHLQ